MQRDTGIQQRFTMRRSVARLAVLARQHASCPCRHGSSSSSRVAAAVMPPPLLMPCGLRQACSMLRFSLMCQKQRFGSAVCCAAVQGDSSGGDASGAPRRPMPGRKPRSSRPAITTPSAPGGSSSSSGSSSGRSNSSAQTSTSAPPLQLPAMPAGAGRRRSRPVQPRGLVPLGAAAAAAPAAYGYATAAAPADAEGGFKPEQLDPEQWMAVLSQAQHNRIVACPGSGKTRVVVQRIVHLLREGCSSDSDDERAGSSSGTRPVQPWNILAITFTNKAAGELKERLKGELGEAVAASVQACTFHSACMRILRRHIEVLDCGRTGDFVINDQDDSEALVKEVLKQVAVPVATAQRMHSDISRLKNCFTTVHGRSGASLVAEVVRLRRPGFATELYTDRKAMSLLAYVFDLYQAELARSNSVDFDDLLSLTVALLQQHPEVQELLQRRWLHVLADEFQDTNSAQYELCRLLVGPHNHFFHVGDPNQAVYSFRGARVEHIHDSVERDFSSLSSLVLASNYRSRAPIVRTAEVVLCAQGAPKLHQDAQVTREGRHDTVRMVRVRNDYAEAEEVAHAALQWRDKGRKLSEFAVLYRANYQAHRLGDELALAGVPYVVSGGAAFWARAEVKDALSMLRVAAKPRDQAAIKRFLGGGGAALCKGLGPKTLESFEELATAHGLPLGEWLLQGCADSVSEEQAAELQLRLQQQPLQTEEQAAALAAELAALGGALPPGVKGKGKPLQVLAAVRGFFGVAQRLAAESTPRQVLQFLMHASGYLLQLEIKQEKEASKEANPDKAERKRKERSRNVELLGRIADQPDAYMQREEEMFLIERGLERRRDGKEEVNTGLQALQLFVDFGCLMTDTDLTEEEGDGARSAPRDAVQLMTLHASKGKEFECVHIVGCDEGMLNKARDGASAEGNAEERRLCYVGMTRAKEQLVMMCACERRVFGQLKAYMPSLFVNEIIEQVEAGQLPGVVVEGLWDGSPHSPPSPGPGFGRIHSGRSFSGGSFDGGSFGSDRSGYSTGRPR